MFERSSSGQRNRALLMRADVTCYVEGGGGNDTFAADISFWKIVFSVVLPDKKVRFLPRGGKPNLESIARQIINDDISNNYVALDSDFDDFTNDKIQDHRIFYTYGYSWENDVFTQLNLIDIFMAITHCDEAPIEFCEELENNILEFTKKFRLPVISDYLALCAGSSVLPRQSPGRIVKLDANNNLFIDMQEIIKLCKEINAITRSNRGTANNFVVDVTRYCAGHVLAHVMWLIMRRCFYNFHRRSAKITLEHLRDIGLRTFKDLLLTYPNAHPIVDYYRAINVE